MMGPAVPDTTDVKTYAELNAESRAAGEAVRAARKAAAEGSIQGKQGM